MSGACCRQFPIFFVTAKNVRASNPKCKQGGQLVECFLGTNLNVSQPSFFGKLKTKILQFLGNSPKHTADRVFQPWRVVTNSTPSNDEELMPRQGPIHVTKWPNNGSQQPATETSHKRNHGVKIPETVPHCDIPVYQRWSVCIKRFRHSMEVEKNGAGHRCLWGTHSFCTERWIRGALPRSLAMGLWVHGGVTLTEWGHVVDLFSVNSNAGGPLADFDLHVSTPNTFIRTIHYALLVTSAANHSFHPVPSLQNTGVNSSPRHWTYDL